MPAKSKPKINRKPVILVMDAQRFSSAAAAVRQAGGEPLCISARDVSALDETLARQFDGLLLTGGGDVDPRLYGEKPHKQVYGVNEVRDYTEWTALDAARDRNLPVLGVCRGSQLMTVHNGGALRQHITGHRGTSHLVFGESSTRFKKIIKGDRAVFVSLHHQVVKRTGNGWRVAARSAEGHIEAVESKDGRCLGVQFHPEMDYTRNIASRRLFAWLTAEAAKRAGLVKPTVQRLPAPPAKPSKARGSTPTPLPRKTPSYTYGMAREGDEQLELLAREARGKTKRRTRQQIKSSWVCRDCGMRFDKQLDRDDHEYWLHGDPVVRVTEPPPGHPDWM